MILVIAGNGPLPLQLSILTGKRSLGQLHVLFLHFLIKDFLKGQGLSVASSFLGAATGCGRWY